MKIVYLFILSFSCCAFANSYRYLLETEDPEVNPNQNKLQNKTTDAILSLDGVQERADYLVYRLKVVTFGEYADNIMFLAPLVTGDIGFQADKFHVYYNHYSNRSGVKYNFSF